MEYQVEQLAAHARDYYETSARYSEEVENAGYDVSIRVQQQLLDELTGPALNLLVLSVSQAMSMHGLNGTSLQYMFLAACRQQGVDLQFSMLNFQDPPSILRMTQFDTGYQVVLDVTRAVVDAAIEVGEPTGNEEVEEDGIKMVLGPATRHQMHEVLDAKLEERFPGIDITGTVQSLYQGFEAPAAVPNFPISDLEPDDIDPGPES